MTNGYEGAKAQRNLLERMTAAIPGFRGFQDRELRRDVDKLEREHLASEVGRLKNDLRARARAYTDAGRIGSLQAFDRLDRQMDGLSQAIRFSDYGATGLFDPVKIGETELARLYEFDLSVLQDLSELQNDVAAVPAPGADDPAPTLDRALQKVGALADKWRGREQVMGSVVKTGAGA
jgi:hypothetical protein